MIKRTFFEIVLGNDGILMHEKIVKLRTEGRILNQRRRNVKYKIKRTEDPTQVKFSKAKYQKLLIDQKEISQEINAIEKS